MDIMDPFTDELLSAPPLAPMFFDDLSPGGALEREQYLHAIGVFGPPLPPAGLDHAAALKPMSFELYADVHFVRPVIEAPAAGAGAKNYSRDYDAEYDSNLRKMEEDDRLRPLPDYLETVQAEAEQPVLSPLTRATLVEWMDELVRDRKLGAATLHRAVSCVDRALSAKVLNITPEHADYQLRYFGAGAVVTAAKYENRRTRRTLAAEVAYYCGFATRQEVLDAELLVAEMLDFDPGRPTAHNFLEYYFTRYYGRGEQELMVERLAHQLADSSLADYGCLVLRPSVVAASAVFLAKLAMDAPPPAGSVQQKRKWNEDFEELTGYKPTDLLAGVQALWRLNLDPGFIVTPEFLQDPYGSLLYLRV